MHNFSYYIIIIYYTYSFVFVSFQILFTRNWFANYTYILFFFHKTIQIAKDALINLWEDWKISIQWPHICWIIQQISLSLSLSLTISLLCLPLTPIYILRAPNRGNTFFPSSSAILLSIPLKFMTFLCSPVYTHTHTHKFEYNYNTTGKTTSTLTYALCPVL